MVPPWSLHAVPSAASVVVHVPLGPHAGLTHVVSVAGQLVGSHPLLELLVPVAVVVAVVVVLDELVPPVPVVPPASPLVPLPHDAPARAEKKVQQKRIVRSLMGLLPESKGSSARASSRARRRSPTGTPKAGPRRGESARRDPRRGGYHAPAR